MFRRILGMNMLIDKPSKKTNKKIHVFTECVAQWGRFKKKSKCPSCQLLMFCCWWWSSQQKLMRKDPCVKCEILKPPFGKEKRN